MISFYPGPSRVHDEIPAYVKDAYKKGILSVNHRSDTFMAMAEKTANLLKQKLNIPEDYSIFYTGSATECWEIIAQSLVTKRSHHVFNGAFGQKWFEYTRKLCGGVKSYPFEREELVNSNKYKFSDEGVICITQNETSNGTQVKNEIIRAIKENNPQHLVAVDATSSMAGVDLEFKSADIWFASVQKCFGLPAGLAVMACSPQAIERTQKIGEKNHYNSLLFMDEMMEKWQTPYTPNVMSIYLLMRVLEASRPIEKVQKKIIKRYAKWNTFFQQGNTLRHLVRNNDAHSYTVIPVTSSPATITRIKKEAQKKGFLLGEGYGDLKSSTFRIANFPAIKKTEIDQLRSFLKAFI